MQAGKHVYVQKPLTATVHEARMLRELALKNPKLVTQMGNQGHSSEGARLINEWIGAGVIGAVHEVHVWTNRPVVYWPQGLARPTSMPPVEAPGGFGNPWTYRYLQDVLAAAMGSGGAPPPGLDWDLYLGPIAENVPYHPVYHPFNWRGWLAFGCGALGDMGAHLIDHPFLGIGAVPSHEHRSDLDAVGHHAPAFVRPRGRGGCARPRSAQAGVVSGLDLRALSIRALAARSRR